MNNFKYLGIISSFIITDVWVLCACDVQHHTDETPDTTVKCATVNEF